MPYSCFTNATIWQGPLRFDQPYRTDCASSAAGRASFRELILRVRAAIPRFASPSGPNPKAAWPARACGIVYGVRSARRRVQIHSANADDIRKHRLVWQTLSLPRGCGERATISKSPLPKGWRSKGGSRVQTASSSRCFCLLHQAWLAVIRRILQTRTAHCRIGRGPRAL